MLGVVATATAMVLAATQDAVGAASSVRFRFEGADTTSPERARGEATAPVDGEGEWTDDGWRILHRGALEIEENLVARGQYFGRWADTEEQLPTTPWEDWGPWDDYANPRDEMLQEISTSLDETADEGELDTATVDWLAVALAAELYLGNLGDNVDWVDLEVMGLGFPTSPAGFLQVVEQSRDPAVVGESGQPGETVTLAATLRATPDVVDAFGGPVPDGEVELDVGPDHLPTALRLAIAVGDESFTVEVHFSDWGSPVVITPPSPRSTRA